MRRGMRALFGAVSLIAASCAGVQAAEPEDVASNITYEPICPNPFVSRDPYILSPANRKALEDCRKAAAKMPTDAGVRLAVHDCHKKFVRRPQIEEAQHNVAAKKQEKARFLAAVNSGSSTLKDISNVLKAPPSYSSEPSQCTAFENLDRPMPKSCITHSWGQEQCLDPDAYQVEVSTSDGQIWSYRTPPDEVTNQPDEVTDSYQ